MWAVPVSYYTCLTSWALNITGVGNTNIILYIFNILGLDYNRCAVPASYYTCLTSWALNITGVGSANIILHACNIMRPQLLNEEKVETSQKIRGFHA